MMSNATPWLPPEALAPERLEPALDQLLQEWSGQWLVSLRARAAPAVQDHCPKTGNEWGWRSSLPHVSIAWTPGGPASVAGAMLGTNVPPGELQGSDRRIIESLGNACVDDLLQRVAKLVSGSGKTSQIVQQKIDLDACSWWEISLGTGKPAFKLALSELGKTRIIKRALPSAERLKLGSLSAALARQEVKIAAGLGRCSLTLAELQGLEIGDVLVLDRSPDRPVELLINGSSSPFCASLDVSGSAAELIIAS